MSRAFKSAWQNGLPLDGIEARWCWVGWQQAIAVSVPEETLTAIHDTLRLVWSRELSADDGMDEIEILIPPTKADEWIKCSDRLPTEDAGTDLDMSVTIGTFQR